MPRKQLYGSSASRPGFKGYPNNSFIGLEDTPASFAGMANYVLTVNGTADGVTAVIGRGVANGFASLDGTGKIPASELPAIAVTEFLGVVANVSVMLALTGQKGDWCIRSDLSTTWVITGTDPTQIGDWTEIAYPAQPYKVMASAADLTPDYLYPKLSGGRNVSVTLLSPGYEIVELGYTGQFFDPVIKIYDNTASLPGSPSPGDRYVAQVTANGWTIRRIYEWDGVSAWLETIPVAGDVVLNKELHTLMNYNGSFWFVNNVTKFSKTFVWYNPSGITNTANVFIWENQFGMPELVYMVAKRTGGTGATVNARQNGVSLHRSVDLSLTTTGFTSAGTLQNTTYTGGDYLEVMLTSVAGSPTQILIQLEFEVAIAKVVL